MYRNWVYTSDNCFQTIALGKKQKIYWCKTKRNPENIPRRTDMVPVGSGKTIIIFEWYNRIPVQTLQKKPNQFLSHYSMQATYLPTRTHVHTHTHIHMLEWYTNWLCYIYIYWTLVHIHRIMYCGHKKSEIHQKTFSLL